MKLINPLDSVERLLSAVVLKEVGDDDGCVYGCGPFKMCEAYEELLAASQGGVFRGTAGLVITETSVTNFPAEVRSAAGLFLKLGRKVFLADGQSYEWAPHFGLHHERESGASLAWGVGAVRAELALSECRAQWAVAEWAPGWLFAYNGAPPADLELQPTEGNHHGKQGIVVIDDVGIALVAAILDLPCLLYCTHQWGNSHRREYNPLTRWAREAGVTGNVCFDRNTLEWKVTDSIVEAAKRDYVLSRREQALEIVRELRQKPGGDVLEAALGSAPPPSPADSPFLHASPLVGGGQSACAGRTMRLGDVFDPSKHYTDDYYGGGAGIHYYTPDGKMAVYHSTAHNWEGFNVVAPWIHQLTIDTRIAATPTLLDIGCGAGDFVRAATACGFNAWGIDISQQAIDRAPSGVKKHLVCGDITKPERISDEARGLLGDVHFDVITALDFWEHIYECDVDRLVKATHDLLKKGGIGFFVICTRGAGENDWTVEPGTKITKENSWLLVSGHVTIRRWGWWANKFREYGMESRLDLSYALQILRSESQVLRSVDSWSPRHTFFVQRT